METTTGMSAPPIAMTMCTPNSSAIAVMTTSAVIPAPGSAAFRNCLPNQITTSSAARLSQWRPGSSTGLPPILPLSLPKAIREPLNVIAPIRMPT
ncbi:hypothetical protein D9M68_952010 [compost metagenome]